MLKLVHCTVDDCPGSQPSNTQRPFYVPELEGKKRVPTGGPDASPTMRPLWNAHAGSVAVETQEDGHM